MLRKQLASLLPASRQLRAAPSSDAEARGKSHFDQKLSALKTPALVNRMKDGSAASHTDFTSKL
jgi:hypothetical protein